METRETKSLYYKRVIWLRAGEEHKETSELFLNLLKDNLYIFKNFDIILNIKELVDLRHTKTAYEYFEELRSIDNSIKTLCIINHESDDYIPRDILISKVTKLWTTFNTAYTNYNSIDNIRCNRAFNYIIESDNLINKLTRIIESGR